MFIVLFMHPNAEQNHIVNGAKNPARAGIRVDESNSRKGNCFHAVSDAYKYVSITLHALASASTLHAALAGLVDGRGMGEIPVTGS